MDSRWPRVDGKPVSAEGFICQRHVRQAEGNARLPLLVSSLLMVTALAWAGATLASKALRERRFAGYPSPEAEQADRSLALLAQQHEAEEKRRNWKYGAALMLLLGLVLLLPPWVWWAPATGASGAALLLGEISGFALASIVSLASSSRGRGLARVLLVLSSLLALAALLCGPALSAARGIGFGALAGTPLALFVRWTSRQRGQAPTSSSAQGSSPYEVPNG
jgi:hypothetical protein